MSSNLKHTVNHVEESFLFMLIFLFRSKMQSKFAEHDWVQQHRNSCPWSGHPMVGCTRNCWTDPIFAVCSLFKVSISLLLIDVHLVSNEDFF